MKFKLFGDLDCPDWVLAEIAILSRMTSVKLKLLCVQVMKELLGGEIDYEKATKLTSDAKFEIGDLKASIAVLSFIFTSACKHDTEEVIMGGELQQLGIPKEHVNVLCKVYTDSHKDLREHLRKQSLRLTSLDDVQWRVDHVISSSDLNEVDEPVIHLKLKLNDADDETKETRTLSMNSNQCSLLLHELKEACKIMESLS